MRRLNSPVGLAFAAFAAFVTFALGPTEALAQAPPAEATAPAYSLEVDSDEPSVLSFDVLAPRLQQDLGGVVVAPGGAAPRQAAIAVRYRGGTLTVRASHAGDRVLERSIRPEGDASAVRAETVLLAGNLARDEARELLDELEARGHRPPAPPLVSTPEVPPAPLKDAVPETHRAATVSFFFPVATNAGEPDVVSPINFGLVYGRVGRSEALHFVPLGVAYASRSVSGLELGTAAAISGGTASGAQLGMASSFAGDHVTGAQLSTVFNYAGGGLGGAQLAAGVNVVTRKSGPPGTPPAESEHFRGVQLTSVANITTVPGHGLQGSAGVNVATAGLDGAQLAVLNIGGDVSGTQIGVVNIGRKVKGLQLGVLNIAEEVDGVALGVASIAKDSIHPIVWGGNLAYTNAGFRFTTKYVYTVIAIGTGTLENGFGGGPIITNGLGGHIPFGGALDGFDLDLEVAYSSVASDTKGNQSLHVRAIPGYKFAKHLRVFVGGGPRIPLDYPSGSLAVRPEVFGGVQF